MSSRVEDVADDSEPERQETLRKIRHEKKALKAIASQPLLGQTQPARGYIVDISDESDPPPPEPLLRAGIEPTRKLQSRVRSLPTTQPDPRERSIIEISGKFQSHVSDDAEQPAASRARVLSPREDDAGDASDGPVLNLGAFAFVATTQYKPPRARSSGKSSAEVSSAVESESGPSTSHRVPSHEVVQLPAPKLKKVTARLDSNKFGELFTDAQMEQVIKCIGCDLAWSIRKTTRAKFQHIQSCIKKSKMDLELARCLIQDAIDAAPHRVASASKPTKGKGKATEPLPDTLLEQMVHNGAPKKKGRRAEAEVSLKPLTDTRPTILGKARRIIGTPSFDAPSTLANPSIRTQAFGESAFGIPATTQGFAKTAFGAAGQNLSTQQFTPSAVSSPVPVEDNVADEEFPSTQPFAPSKYGSRPPAAFEGNFSAYGSSTPVRHSYMNEENYPDASAHGPASPSPRQQASTSKLSPSVPSSSLPIVIDLDSSARGRFRTRRSKRSTNNNGSSSSVEILSRPQSVEPRREQRLEEAHPLQLYNHKWVNIPWLPEPYAVQEPYDDDLQPGYDPGDDNYDDAFLRYDPDIPFPEPRMATPPPFLSQLPTPAATTTTKPKPKPKQQPGFKRVNNDEVFNQAWEHNIRDLITSDTALHLRILRFEPIRFDVFMDKARMEGISDSRMRMFLRPLVDKLGINTYAADGNIGQKRTKE